MVTSRVVPGASTRWLAPTRGSERGGGVGRVGVVGFGAAAVVCVAGGAGRAMVTIVVVVRVALHADVITPTGTRTSSKTFLPAHSDTAQKRSPRFGRRTRPPGSLREPPIVVEVRLYESGPRSAAGLVGLAEDPLNELGLSLGVAVVVEPVEAKLQLVVLGKESWVVDQRVTKRREETVSLRAGHH